MQSFDLWIQITRFGSCNFLESKKSVHAKTWYSRLDARRADSKQFSLSLYISQADENITIAIRNEI